MRAIVVIEGGVVELNWMWLPTWIGMNTTLKTAIEQELTEKIVGKTTEESDLDEINELVINYLQEKFNIEGLYDYLDGLKFVQET